MISVLCYSHLDSLLCHKILLLLTYFIQWFDTVCLESVMTNDIWPGNSPVLL